MTRSKTEANSVRIWGTRGDDRLRGGDGNDRIVALGGDDTMVGGTGNDILVGGAGADRLHGGGRLDTALLQGSREDYQITRELDGAFTVRHAGGVTR
jgi:Ca2+-binding RTX toxin-like protein